MKLKKYLVQWYSGNILDILHVHNEKYMLAESIDKVKFLDILPDYEKKRYEDYIKYGVRVIYSSDTTRNVDYGSYSSFIQITELKGE